MKKYWLFIVAVAFISCTGNSNTSIATKTKSYEMGMYKVDVPESLQPNSGNTSNFSYWRDKDNFLIVEKGEKMTSAEMKKRYEESVQNYRQKGFNVKEISRDPESACFKMQKGMFMSKSCYVLTECGGAKFLVSYSGVGANMDQARAVANSIKMRIETAPETSTKPIYENALYAIEYPTGWKYLTNPDGVSDVYIGEENVMFGFTIMHVKTEYSIDYIIENEKSTWKQLGLAYKYSKTNVAGQEAYKCVASGIIQGFKVKNISYSFKYKDVFYNIKFGNDTELVDKNKALIDEIVNSFSLK